MENPRPPAYSATARRFHWWTAALIAIQLPLGFSLLVRGTWLNIWDSVTDNLFSTHKLLGMIILCLVAARLIYRAIDGAPDPEPGAPLWERLVANTTHWAIYALLVAVPTLGWFGTQLFPALNLFGLFSLPALVAPNKAASDWVLQLHGRLAAALFLLIIAHIAAALFHAFIRRDGVLTRMWPGLGPPKP
jgi:cytochrome b561